MWTRRLIFVALTSLLATLASAAQVLKVAASAVPHAEILEFVKPQLKAQGVDLQIKVFTDYVQPNLQVEEKQLDANFFQHQPYLDAFNREHGTHIVAVPNGKVHIEPFGAYSKKIKSLAQLRDGAQIAIPNDPSNSGRALVLLQKQGLIKLKDPTNIMATTRDISSNPRKLKIRELEAATLPRVLDDVDVALINTNYALAARTAANARCVVHRRRGLALREPRRRPSRQRQLARHRQTGGRPSHTPAAKKFVQDKYRGAVVTTF